MKPLRSLADMIRFHGHAIVDSSKSIEATKFLLDRIAKEGKQKLEGEVRTEYCSYLVRLHNQVRLLGFGVCLRLVDNLIERMNKGDPTVDELVVRTKEIQDAYEEKAYGVHFFILSVEETKAFNDGRDFLGADVAAKMPSLSVDIAEAAKCFALTRYTACAFHLGLVVEAGLHHFAGKLGVVPTSHMKWSGFLTQANDIVANIPNANPNKPLYASILTHFSLTRWAWRNDTFHPGMNFAPQQAKDLIVHVRQFMAQVASTV